MVKGFEANDNNEDWLLDETEKFCQDKAVYNAIMESISIIDGKTDKGRGALPSILSDALSVSFDPHIGHDFIEDADARWDFYHTEEVKIKFDLDLNLKTKFGRSGNYKGPKARYHDIQVDNKGNIYVGDILNNTIQKFKPIKTLD